MNQLLNSYAISKSNKKLFAFYNQESKLLYRSNKTYDLNEFDNEEKHAFLKKYILQGYYTDGIMSKHNVVENIHPKLISRKYDKIAEDVDDVLNKYINNKSIVQLWFDVNTIQRCALYNIFKHVEFQDEDASELESYLMSKRGQLYYKKPGVYENMYSYDINSMFPYILSFMKIPTGFLEKSDNIEFENIPSLYKIKLNYVEFENIPNFFKFHDFEKNNNNIQTFVNYIDIKILMKMNIEFIIISKYIYKFVKSEEVPELVNFIKDCSDLKNKLKKGPSRNFVKRIISTLHGTCSQKNCVNVNVNDVSYDDIADNVDDSELKINKVIKRTKDTGDGKKDRRRTFLFPLFRIQSFILSASRYLMLIIYTELKNKYSHFNCVKITVDSFTCNLTPEEINAIYPINDKLGSLKLETVHEKVEVK